MAEANVSPKQAVIHLMKGVVPERRDEIDAFWSKYAPAVVLVEDARGIALAADKDHIEFNPKTMSVFWMIAFAGWRAIECYSPSVILAFQTGQTVADVLNKDAQLCDVERDYKERRAAAQTLIETGDAASAPWPPDLPRPGSDREGLPNDQCKVAFDLSCIAAAFTFFHEFHHVMLDCDGNRPPDRRVEEMACDVWARQFMTAKLESYANAKNLDFHEVLRLRSMGLAVAALILHEITPLLHHGGNCEYFAIVHRLRTLLDNTPLPAVDPFWIFVASLLIGIFRQKAVEINAPTMAPADLARHLLDRL